MGVIVLAILLVIGLTIVGLFDPSGISSYLTTMGSIAATLVSIAMVHEKVAAVQKVNEQQTQEIETVKKQTNGMLEKQFAAVHARMDEIVKPTMIKGLDVSSYQGDNYPVDGLDFAFVKATEGTHYTNPDFVAQTHRARKAGMLVGHYHYLHHGNITAQALYFIRAVKHHTLRGDVLFVDWEDPATTERDRNEFLRLVMKAFLHNRVGVYCNKDFWFNRDTQNYCGDFLFIAAPSDPPGHPGIEHPWTFHQYSSTDGYDHDVANFRSRADMLAWARGETRKAV